MRIGIKGLVGATGLFISGLVAASTWVPINYNGLPIFVPKPSIGAVQHQTFYEEAAPTLYINGFGQSSALYYQVSHWQNNAWQHSSWSCISAKDLTAANYQLTLPEQTLGRYQVHVSASLDGLCNTSSFSPNTQLNSPISSSGEFYVLGMQNLDGLDAQSNPVATFEQAQNAQQDWIYDLQLSWPMNEGFDHAELILYKDEIPYSFNVAFSDYQQALATNGHYRLVDSYNAGDSAHSNQGFLPYFGPGDYRFEIKYCSATECSASLKRSDSLTVKPQRPVSSFISTHENFNFIPVGSALLEWTSDARVPNFRLQEGLVDTGAISTNVVLPADDVDFYRASGGDIIDQDDGTKYYKYYLRKAEEGFFFFNILNCADDICGMSNISTANAHNNSVLRANIQFNDFEVTGQIDRYVGGSKLISGWAFDGDGQTQVALFYNGEQRGGFYPANQFHAGRDNNTGFVIPNIDSLLSDLDFTQPVTVEIRALNVASSGNELKPIGSVTLSHLENLSPIAVADTANVSVGETHLINVLANDSDPEGHHLIVKIDTSVSPDNGNLSVAPNGMLQLVVANSPKNRTFSAAYHLEDELGAVSPSVPVTFSVGDYNAAPTFAPLGTVVMPEDETRSVTLVVRDNDTMSHRLNVSAVSSNSELFSLGSLYISGTGGSRTLNLAPRANKFGDADITVTVNDGDKSSSATFHVTVNPVNDAPSANNDVFRIGSGEQELDVLANDTDAEGDSLSIQGITVQPQNGTLRITPFYVYYTPSAGFSGVDEFRYRVTDGRASSSEARVLIQAANSGELIAYDDAATFENGVQQAITIDALANDVNADGPNIELTLLADATPQMSISGINSLSDAGTWLKQSFNQVRRDVFGSSIRTYSGGDGEVSSDKKIVFTPVEVISDPVCIPYQIKHTVTHAFSQAKACVTPVIHPQDDLYQIEPGTQKLLNVLANDAVPAVVKAELFITQQPTHGILTLQDGTAGFGEGHGAVIYTPNAGYQGADSFDYAVRVNGGLPGESATVTLDISYAEPTVATVRGDAYQVKVDTATTLHVLANDDISQSGLYRPLVTRQPLNGQVQIVEGEVAAGISRYAIRYTPNAGYQGVDELRYRVVKDGLSPSESEGRVTLNVVEFDENTVVDFSKEVPSVTKTLELPVDGTGNVVGVTSGNFKVSESGAATYAIPLRLPAGTGSVAPSLALVYNSQNETTGLLGVGWNLSGMSGIGRCPKNKETDDLSAFGGYVKPVVKDNTDAFCLDGQRLLLVDAANNIYRKHRDNFSEIEAVYSGSNNSNPIGFIERTKAGDTNYYGNIDPLHSSANAVVSTDGVNIRWQRASIADPYGTRIKYSYDQTGGEFFISTITYGVNTVTFEYEDSHALEKVTGYWLGKPLKQNKRLSGIKAETLGQEFRSYHLTYDTDVADVSRLLSVKECVAQDCLKPVSFEWQTHDTSEVDTSNIYVSDEYSRNTIQVYDVNADGLTDVVVPQFINSGYVQFKIHFGGSTSAYTTNSVSIAANKDEAIEALAYSRIAVISPSGRPALIYPYESPEDQYTYIGLEFESDIDNTECLIPALGSNCQEKQLTGRFKKLHTSFTYTAAPNYLGEVNHDAYLLTDINGDGMSDVMFRENGAVKSRLNDGQGNINGPVETLLSIDMPEIRALHDELMQQIIDETPCIIQKVPLPSTIPTPTNGDCAPPEEIRFQFEGYKNYVDSDGFSRTQLDINGDGRQDYVTNLTLETITEVDWDGQQGGHTFGYTHRTVGVIAYSVGSTYRIEKAGNSFDLRGSSIPVDVNNDGLTDLLIFTHDKNKKDWKWYVSISDGTKLLPSTPLPELDNIEYGERLLLTDYTGDGRVNFLRSTTIGRSSSCPSPWFVNYLDTTQSKPVLVRQSDYAICHGRRGEDATQRFGDFDGDGLQDWIKSNGADTGYDLIIRQQNKNTVNAITTFVDGLGNRTDVDYGRLSDAQLYTVGSDVAFPLTNLTSGPSIVKAVHSDDGYAQNGTLAVGKQSLTYRYQGLRTHMWGHGTLGFEAIQSTDSRNPVYDIVSTTRYAHGLENGVLVNPNIIGSPIETWVERVNRTDTTQRDMLSHKTNTYQSITTINSVEPNATVNPTFTYLSKTVDESAGLSASATSPNGSGVIAMPTIETTTTYDNWGNALTNESVTIDGAKEWRSKTVNWYGAAHPSDKGGAQEPQECLQVVSNAFAKMQRFGRLSCSQTTKTIPDTGDGSAVTGTRTAAFEYSADSGILSKEVTAVGTGTEITTAYEYDQFGNKIKITSQAKNLNLETLQQGEMLTRETSYEFDETGRFPVVLRNAAGHSTCYVYDPVRLVITQETVNVTSCDDLSKGLSAYYTYNSFGEKTGSKDPLGIVTLTESEWCSSEPCQTEAGITPYKYRTKAHSDGAKPSYVYFDQLGREYLTSSVNLDGSTVYSYSEFNREGKVIRTYAPSSSLSAFVNTAPNKQGTMEYDILGRVVKTVVPSFNGNLTTTTTEYEGHKVTYQVTGVGANGETISNTTSSTVNALGQTVIETDADGKNMHFVYTPFGHTRKTVDSKGNTITATFSNEGEQLTLQDPDKGFWEYRYNGFGERIYQKDAKNQITHIFFDSLGRTERIVANATSSTLQEVTCYSYDSAFLGSEDTAILRRGTDSCAASHSGQDIQRIDTAYDELSRVTSTTTTLYPSAINPSFKQLYTRNYYDGLGRVAISQLDNQYAVLSEFNANGFAHKTVGLNADANGNVVSQTLEEVLEVNDWGKATSVRLLSNVTQAHHYDVYTGLQVAMDSGVTSESDGAIDYDYAYDSFGNLRSRTIYGMDASAQVETFQYDNLFRLKSYQVNGAIAERYCYDELGNMTAKQSGFVDCATANDYVYGNSTKTAGGNAGVHAVRQIASRGLSFTYDNNGNMVSDGQRTIAYDHNDKPTQITKAGVQRVSFDYGLGGSRFIRQDKALTSNTDDFGDNQNRRTIYHGAVEYVDVLSSDSQQVIRQQTRYDLGGIVLTAHQNTGVLEAHILVQDHLGSTIAIANAQGVAESRYRYEPFGTQRQISTGYLSSVEVKGYLPVTQRGFTGHEMLPNLDIIHMNGRIYDPTIGRFLQADPHVQAPSNMQNLNRYSYVLNNPLSYTDPSGYFFSALFDGLNALFAKLNSILGDFAPFLGVALMFTGAGAWALEAWWKAAIYGFATGGVASGSLKGAVNGAISGVVFQQIGVNFDQTDGGFFQEMGAAHIGAHALAGGILSILQGGKFGHGFFSAGISKAININALLPGTGEAMNALRTFVASVVGGTVSALTGGKFANGAITSGFGQALNGNSFWKKVEELGDFIIDYYGDAIKEAVPGYQLYKCATESCGYLGWTLAVADTASLFVGGGALTAAFKIFKATRLGRKTANVTEKVDDAVVCMLSFAPETVVLTYEGYKPISSLAVGELVLARNDETGEATWRPIEAVLNSIHANDIIELTVQNKDGVTETITTTAEHPFMLRNTGWVDAAELASGDVIAGIHDDNAITVVDVRLVETQLYTYNLTVAQDHTYFVGYTDMWVHNANSKGGCGGASKGALRYKLKPQDKDWRGTGKTYKDALDDAFKQTGLDKSEFKVTKWGRDTNGKSFPTEYRHKSGAEVNIDWSHAKNGPDAPHVGWQTAGKRGSGGAVRGHTILDSVPYNR